MKGAAIDGSASLRWNAWQPGLPMGISAGKKGGMAYSTCIATAKEKI